MNKQQIERYRIISKKIKDLGDFENKGKITSMLGFGTNDEFLKKFDKYIDSYNKSVSAAAEILRNNFEKLIGEI